MNLVLLIGTKAVILRFGWRPNAKKWDSHVVDMKLSGPEYVNSRPFSSFKTDDIFDTYEEARLDVIRKMIDTQSSGTRI